MLLVLVALFLVLPFAELAVIITVASEVGVLETIGLLILVSVVGAWLCKREGLGVMRRIRDSLDRGELPHREVVDGGLILFAGALLLTPGFLTDCLAILLLLPPTRLVARSIVLRILSRYTAVGRVGRRAGRTIRTDAEGVLRTGRFAPTGSAGASGSSSRGGYAAEDRYIDVHETPPSP